MRLNINFMWKMLWAVVFNLAGAKRRAERSEEVRKGKIRPKTSRAGGGGARGNTAGLENGNTPSCWATAVNSGTEGTPLDIREGWFHRERKDGGF